MTVAWFHCYAGVAGDMALGALIDAGADLDEVRGLLQALPLPGWSLGAEPVLRGGLAATHIRVGGEDNGVIRTHASIVEMINRAVLPDRVRGRSLAVFAALAEVEGRLHRRNPAHVHFHEVGGVDAIVDIVGTCAALEVLGVDRVEVSPVATGIGVVRTAHGLLPNPSPATVELLAGFATYGRDVPFELTTPTGAALMTTLASSQGPLPAMVVASTGYGAGSRELDDMPNCTQVVLGEPVDRGLEGQPLVLVEANVDDATGETLAHTVSALIEAGCADAWVTPVVMKKGRPGHVVSALVDPAVAGQAARVLRSETGSLGARFSEVARSATPRKATTVTVEGMPVRIKVSPGRVKAEHDDAARVASLRGLPVREVARRAESAWAAEHGDGPGDAPPGG